MSRVRACTQIVACCKTRRWHRAFCDHMRCSNYSFHRSPVVYKTEFSCNCSQLVCYGSYTKLRQCLSSPRTDSWLQPFLLRPALRWPSPAVVVLDTLFCFAQAAFHTTAEVLYYTLGQLPWPPFRIFPVIGRGIMKQE